MKSLVLALLLFAVVVYGIYDVKPFRMVKRVLRRVPGGKTGPLRQPHAHEEHEHDVVATGTGPIRRRR